MNYRAVHRTWTKLQNGRVLKQRLRVVVNCEEQRENRQERGELFPTISASSGWLCHDSVVNGKGAVFRCDRVLINFSFWKTKTNDLETKAVRLFAVLSLTTE